jgi:uncharacterized protein (DUF1697 family)
MPAAVTSAPASPRLALLRGVNVGAKKVAMTELRAVATRLGYTHVSTLINSGNLVYGAVDTTAAEDEQRLHDAIAHDLGVRCTVFVRTREQVGTILRECPFIAEAALDAARLLVTIWDEDVTRAALEGFGATPLTVERFAVGAHALYCWLPDGISASVPYEKASRRLGDHITARNWSTMTKLLARLEEIPAGAVGRKGGTP